MAEDLYTNPPILAEPSPIIPAATVVLVRDGELGPEILLVRRVGRGAFGGFSVFPGGRVDPEDTDPVAPHDDFLAARRAAVREAAEEVNLNINEHELVPFSHWTPPPFEMKRFGTWFFVAPTVAGDIEMSEGELTEFDWISPAEALAKHAEGVFTMAPPTWITLHDLQGFLSVDQMLAALREREAFRYLTWPIRRKPLILTWANDSQHMVGIDDVDVESPGGRHRLHMHDDGWVFERTGW
jgi:8-oxo-dGTP pyrophosphatase MutT (NUDIX family)